MSDPIYQGGGNYAHQMSHFWHFCVLCHVNFQKLLNLFYSSKIANFHNFTFSNKLNFFPIAICISLSLRLLKVGKSQKHFFLKLHWPKNERNIWQNYALAARAEFCQIFRSFFGHWSIKKKCFWGLLTFNTVLLFACLSTYLFS